MRRIFVSALLAVATGAFTLIPSAHAVGPEGAIVSPSGHVCSTGDPAAPNVGPETGCTYTSTVAGGYAGQGPFSITAVQGITTVFSFSCPDATQCSTPTTGDGSNPIPAGSTVTVSSGGGLAAVGSATS